VKIGNVLTTIKKDIEGHVGEKVTLKANGGRRKIVVNDGVLEKTYDSTSGCSLSAGNASVSSGKPLYHVFSCCFSHRSLAPSIKINTLL